MFKKLLAALAALYAVAAFAAVDVNKATAAELDGIKGIGPGISTKILDERKKGQFKDWTDFVTRVQGVGETNAAKFSAEGMTVNGQGFKGVAAAPKADAKPMAKKEEKPMAAKEEKPMAKKDDKPAAAAPAAAAKPEMKKDEKPAKEDKAMAKKDEKAMAKKDEKPAKEDKAMAKKDDKKVDDKKPAASGAKK
jgi:competence protein ComEA